MKKILFIINGFGLGNSTRCSSVIEHLIELNYSVDILTAENGLKYFSNAPLKYAIRVFSQKQFTYKLSKGKLNIWKTILYPPIFYFYLYNALTLLKLLKKNSYNAIIIDSDYSIFLWKIFLNIPVIAINNSETVIKEIIKINKIPPHIQQQLMVERLDNFFHKLVPDLVISPSLLSTTTKKCGKYYSSPPIIRNFLTESINSQTVKHILIMLSGSRLEQDLTWLAKLRFTEHDEVRVDVVGLEGKNTSSMKFHGETFEIDEFIGKADIMVINAGLSSVSEAVVLKKPCVVIPIDNHAEQYINAQLIQERGLGLMANQDNVCEKIYELIKTYKKFAICHQKYNYPANSSLLAAQAIDEIVSKANK